MAIVSDRKMVYERKIAELQTQLTEVSRGPAAHSGLLNTAEIDFIYV